MSIASEITRLQNAKADIKTAIETKGVTVPSSAKLDDYSTYVDQIQTGGGTNKLKNIIEGNVTSMSASDFEGATKIQQDLFANSPLTSVVIPNTVKSIGCGAFGNCSNLTSITFQGNINEWGYGVYGDNTYYNNVFRGCTGLTSFTLPSSDPDVTEIKGFDYMFNKCTNLTTVDLSSLNGKTISGASYMFTGCTSLSAVTMPTVVPTNFYSSTYVFKDCSSLQSINLPSSARSTPLGSNFFQNCTSLDNVVLPNTITKLNSNAFSGCSSLTTITLPSNITSTQFFGDKSFEKCTSLTTFTIPSGQTIIPNRTFNECTGLTSVTIPASLTKIDQYAFYGTSSLTALTYLGTMAQWGSITKGNGWKQNSAITTIHCTDGDITL